MKMAKKLVVAAVVLPLTLGTASAFAFGGKDHKKGGHGECGGGFDRGMMRQLDLTDAQKEQLKEMREAGKQEMKANFKGNFSERQAEMQAHHAKVQQLVLADNFDQAAADELAKAMVEKQTERKVKMLEKQHQMLSILTPEQKAKFTELQQERMGKCAEKMQKRFADK
ncbi:MULTISPECIES: CpxP family protein [Vibrio]|uniref:Periplasmic repressor CpxP n=3 Tax=Vibrio TaxID=662 RepID=A0A0A5HYW0_PHOS4|nr:MULTISPECIES: CpxP family protein [Vibrio]KGY10757.1 periplasmic repressor CpxP [Vibrio sinaloensis]KHA58886.1 periplasmic repressor CpxP [Vibrio variabilis]KHD23286.1 periplasmic repressor CpxP [Vibrio caribbeanicus]KHT43901.1 periplasmic repressor CpxP [Vibrio sinaloensis]KHT44286.1 periplasmic repressor CpxP [Vibrio sinaloensis]